MNICMLAYAFYDTDGRIRRYAETLVKNGHSVEAICLRSSDQSNMGELNGVRIYRIQQRTRNEESKWSYLIKLIAFFCKSALYVTKRHLQCRYDVIHVHSVPDFQVFSTLIPKISGSKIILDIHDIVPELYASKFGVSRTSFIFTILLWVEKLSIRYSDHVIIANDLWFGKLTGRSVSKDKCTSIINYPDPDIFYRRNSVKRKENFIMLYPGTLNEHQGIDTVLLALRKIKNELSGFKFHIYGDGSEKRTLQQLTKDLELDQIVIFFDMQPMERIAEEIAGADLGVVAKKKSSFGNEAFSTKILEFMTQGVPVIVADTSIDKYYFNSDVVRYFESENPDNLASAILEMYTNDELRKRIAEESQKYVVNFSWDKKQDIYLKIIECLVRE